MSASSIRTSLAAFIVAAVVSAACTNNSSSPTAPAPTPTPAPAPAPAPPAPPATASVQVTINPNPAPFSGQPIDTSGCAGSKNTWFYDQILKESGGAAVTFTNRVDKFDGRIVNSLSGLSLVVPANASLTVATRWCSSQAVAHTAQSSFSGMDANGHAISIDAPVVSLKSP